MEGLPASDGDRGDAADAVRRGRSERSRDLAQYVAQCAVPVRVGQEVQALPRPVGITPKLNERAPSFSQFLTSARFCVVDQPRGAVSLR